MDFSSGSSSSRGGPVRSVERSSRSSMTSWGVARRVGASSGSSAGIGSSSPDSRSNPLCTSGWMRSVSRSSSRSVVSSSGSRSACSAAMSASSRRPPAQPCTFMKRSAKSRAAWGSPTARQTLTSNTESPRSGSLLSSFSSSAQASMSLLSATSDLANSNLASR